MRLAVDRRIAILSRQDAGDNAHGPKLMADKSFGRYGPMDRHEVRGLKVEGTELERLRARREMLRSLAPEKARDIIEFHKGLTFFEALALAKQEGKLIVPNDINDRILTETTDEQYLSLRQNYPVWTGTLVIYEAPDKKFGEQVVFSWKDIHTKVNYSISFLVPEQFQGKTNCALVIEHPDFEIKTVGENEYEIKSLGEIRLLESFPKENGWYNTDPETKIPIGEPVKESEDARHFWRLDSAYIGSVARVGVFYGRRRGAGAYDYWSDSGVVLFPVSSDQLSVSGSESDPK